MKLHKKLVFLSILVLGLAFRIYNINWDNSCCQHPDERAIVMFTLPISFPKDFNEFLSPGSPLNPHFFAYGNLPLYLLKSTSIIASNFNPEFLTYGKMNLIGRGISVFADIGTMILIFLITKILINRKTALAASFIYAVSVLPIQYSHFYTVDTLLTFFVLLTLWRCLKFYNKPNIVNAASLGAAFGLSLATKVSASTLIIPIILAVGIDFLFIFLRTPHKVKTWLPNLPNFLKKLITEGLVICTSTVVTFVIFQPYAIIDFNEFLKQNILQSQMTHNAYIFPYTLQYVGKATFFYEIKNIFLWGLGPFVTVFSLFGLFNLITKLKSFPEKNRSQILIVLTFFILYFLVVGSFAVGWMRYLLPIYPILAILGGITFITLLNKLEQIRFAWLKFAGIIVLLFLVLSWPLSFLSVYKNKNTRLAATDWINKNIPSGSTIAIEHWDDRIPMYSDNGYNFQELNLYDQPDDKNKWRDISQKLNNVNYLIIASNRLYVPIQQLSDCTKFRVCFPIASEYYHRLFNEASDFKKIAEFTSYPTIPLLRYEINDQEADESFTVYDHPKIMVFKRYEL